MKQNKNRIVLRKDDYEVMTAYLKGAGAVRSYDRINAEELESELKRATVVAKNVFPKNVVRLNSTVLIKDEKEDKILELTVVTPEKADIRDRKISFMAPIGTALIGFKEGEKVKWNVPAGKKEFLIMKVINNHD